MAIPPFASTCSMHVRAREREMPQLVERAASLINTRRYIEIWFCFFFLCTLSQKRKRKRGEEECGGFARPFPVYRFGMTITPAKPLPSTPSLKMMAYRDKMALQNNYSYVLFLSNISIHIHNHHPLLFTHDGAIFPRRLAFLRPSLNTVHSLAGWRRTILPRGSRRLQTTLPSLSTDQTMVMALAMAMVRYPPGGASCH